MTAIARRIADVPLGHAATRRAASMNQWQVRSTTVPVARRSAGTGAMRKEVPGDYQSSESAPHFPPIALGALFNSYYRGYKQPSGITRAELP